MTTQPTLIGLRRGLTAALLAMVTAAGCSDGGVDGAMVDTTPQVQPTIETTADAQQPFDATIAAVNFMAAVEAHINHEIAGSHGSAAINDAATLIDRTGVTIDLAAVATCVGDRTDDIRAIIDETYELTFEGFKEYAVNAELSIVAFRAIEVVPAVSDRTTFHALYVGPKGIIGERPVEGDSVASCWETALTRDEPTEEAFAAARAADSDDVDPLEDAIGAASPKDTSLTARQPSTVDSGEDQWLKRPGFPADPNDPEPIRSTGSNKWDIIEATDPSTFVCLAYLGQGPEEILDRAKDHYETVPDAYLFVARFEDGTSIDIRVHPEIGDLDAVRAEVDRYVVPLGQLPTILRRDIGRFAIRLGDETATASYGEGISIQSGNAATRAADSRLEETLFHEAVHTSLDHQYSYQRSADWLQAQELDGKFLTEYGRENPDSEDLAETALYAFGVLHHPDRLPANEGATILSRIPNRVNFIRALLPPGEPIFKTVAPSQGC